jgi:glutamine synthetase
MVVAMESMGIRCEFQHHEVGAAGQAEINIRFNPLLKVADQIQLQKYVCKNVARQAGKTVTFMPKPVFEANGSGMHVHQSLSKDGENVMYDFNGFAQLSREALNYIGGLIKHGKALMAFCAPTTNSYRRLVPGYEAPVNLVYSQRNRSAACRIPVYSSSPKAKRVEFRPPDPSANPYLAFSALLMAGLDGIQNRIDPGSPLDVDLFELSEEELAGITQIPGSLDEALDALEEDHEFLLKGGVFTEDVIETWIRWKRKEESEPIRLRPHPWEFALYYDV